uniref:atlastin-2-like n=1 Tax=Styela clava TaxID=7725 RepID=UPI00193AC3B0|nr:atlastin-2-like [Styela clava]
MASHFGRAVSITKSGKKGFLEIDDDELEAVLIRPDIGDRPIAIISIAGSMRTGKSFIQNFLLRYLRNRGWENDSWMGTDDTSANDGMTWRGGRDRMTTGIIIWNEVFYVPDASGSEVAVLIMDTQGLFDNETIKENNVKLFTLSALMSSVQVLNVMRQIEERDLENLQLCVEFATKAAQQSEAQFKLQKLLFLVRDYSFDLEYGLEDGNKYLEEVLRPRSGRHQLTEIRSHLRSSFSNLCCFLMPPPGSKVMNTKNKFEGKNKEIDEEFLKELPNFVESLLHPKNLLAKISNGKLVTAMEIRNLILACDRIFVEGKLPPIETLLEATTKAHYETHYQTCMKKYSEGIKDILVSESYIDESILKDIHQNAMKYAMDSFDSTLKVGSAEIRKKYRDNLTQSCEEKYDNMLKSNNNNQEKILGDLEKIRIGRQNQYEKMMKEVLIGGSIEDSEFEQHHRSFMEEAIIDFKKRSEHEKYEKFRQDHELQLIDDISKYFEKERKENGKRNDVEKKRRMEKEQAEVKNIHYNLLDVYSKSLREILSAQSTPAKQLEEHHIECIETVKVQYTSQTEKYEWLPDNYWENLKHDIIEVYKGEEKSNQEKIQMEQELKEEKDKLELHRTTEQSKLDYENKLEKVCIHDI